MLGTADCNANCPECAGRKHRNRCSPRDGTLWPLGIMELLMSAHGNGCRRVVLTGAGEPTLSPIDVHIALMVINTLREDGLRFDQVKLYTNGLRIGLEEDFAKGRLARWRSMGLTDVSVTVYSDSERRHAEAIGVTKMPNFADIFLPIIRTGLTARACVVLKKGYTDDTRSLLRLARRLQRLGVSELSAWPLKDLDGQVSPLAPSDEMIAEMQERLASRAWQDALPDIRVKIRPGCNQPGASGLLILPDGELTDIW